MSPTPNQFIWQNDPRFVYKIRQNCPGWGGGKTFLSYFVHKSGGHWARRSLRRPWKLGLRIVAWSKPRMFCEERLGNIKFRVFPKRAGARILSLESVDYFGTSEHYWVVEKKKRILISKTETQSSVVNFHCMQMALWWACGLFSAMIEITCHVNYFFDLWQWCNFSGIEALEFLCLYRREQPGTADEFPVVASTRTKSIQKQVKGIDVDKV